MLNSLQSNSICVRSLNIPDPHILFREDTVNITILGAGAMGALFGSFLSQCNHVTLVDVNAPRVSYLNQNGIKVREEAGERVFHPTVTTDTGNMPAADLLIVFVKAMFTTSALEANRHLIGKSTYLMTLQNGAGHEAKLLQFADAEHVIIGSTQHNSSIISEGYLNHGGGGLTSIGLLGGNSARIAHIAQAFTCCGIDCVCSDEVKKQIWNKLFLNTSASSLTAVLQVPLGFILDDPYACSLMEELAREAVAVANAEGTVAFDAEQVIGDIKTLLSKSKTGYTSIYADVKNGVRSEVDTISGSVVETAERLRVFTPYHRMIVALIHAMENKVAQGVQ